MGYSFLITLREGLEAALILAIILGYLARTGHRQHWRPVWFGAGAAGGASLAAAVALHLLAVELPGRLQEAIEGIGMLLATAILTWMVFWMRAQSRTVGANLRARVDAALSTGSAAALALLAFTSVGREGLETALFLFAGGSTADSEALYWAGAAAGVGTASVIGAAVYSGSHRIPLRTFFTVTSLMLMVLAAGLLTNGLKELHEANILFGNLGPRAWDTYELLPDNSSFGRFLATLVGYDASPFLGQVVAYVAYLAVMPVLYLLTGPGEGSTAQPRAAARA
ncbi:Ferrous iron permease EfeU [bacterium HR29]|jgi:high-affinity iron transporter|nr:Ferrous iron permease EfeU [bacterium HR29]